MYLARLQSVPILFLIFLLVPSDDALASGIPNSGRLLSATSPAGISVGEPLTITATVENTTQPFLGTFPEPWNFYGAAPSWIVQIENESWVTTPQVYQYRDYDPVFWGGGQDSLVFSLSETNLPGAPGNYAVLVNSFNPYDNDFAYIYYVRMTDSPKIVYFSITNGPVVIRGQPQSQTVAQGSNVVFTVRASGSTQMAYQWRLNGGNITGATNASLALTGVTTNKAGSYTVRVSNSFNSVASDVAVLTVALPPGIIGQPQPQRVLPGASAAFTVSASGTAPLTYQWYRNAEELTQQTNATLSITNTAVSDAGFYSAMVRNVAGNVVSSNAPLRIQIPQYLASPVHIPNGGYRITFSQSDGGPLFLNDLPFFELQSSSNLVQWSKVTNSFELSNGTVVIDDTAAAVQSRRFYRVMER